MTARLPRTMRAMQIVRHGGLDALASRTVDLPTPGRGQVLIRVHAAAVNNTDLWTREGAYGDAADPDAKAGWRGAIAFPRTQGADFMGVVVAAGDPESELLGRRVVVDPALYDSEADDANPVGLLGSERDGGYAEYAVADADRVHDVTGCSLADEQLAALPTAYGTALGMIERGRLVAGETVLVTGASGGVGIAAIQLARALGAEVIAVSSRAKASAVLEAGAHRVVAREDAVSQELERLPRRIDVVLDVVAGRLLDEGLPLLAEGGRWVVAGALGGHATSFDVRRLYLHNRQLIGSSMHSPATFARLVSLAMEAAFHPVIASRHHLEEAADAQAALARRTHVGKIVLIP